jgi:uncharacterized protein YjdB
MQKPASRARLFAVLILGSSTAAGQSSALSITNYKLVSQQTIQGTLNVTYRADLVNTGTALGAVTAVVTSPEISGVHVAPGQNTLQFPPVPANGQVTASGTFTVQLLNASPANLSQLQWSFQAAGILLPANATVAPGDTVSFPAALGVAAPPGGVFITLASSNPTIASVSPSIIFVAEGLTTAPRAVPSITGYNDGSVTITASAPGYTTASAQVQVTSGGSTPTMSFWPGSLTINENTTQNLTLNLSAPATAGLTVSLNSSDTTVATVPPAIGFGSGAVSVSVPVTGVAVGTVTITASAPNVGNATAGVTVAQPSPGGILLPANLTVAPGNSTNFPVALGTPAPSGGVFIALASNDPSMAAVSPSTIFVAEGLTTAPRAAPAVTGFNAGSVTVTASAPGYATASTQVQVTGGGPTPATTLSFSPGSLTINGTATQNLALNLSAPAPAGLAVGLSSSDSTVATVPAAVNFAMGATSVPVPVTGVAAGSATITASAPNVASATASVSVTQPAAGGILLPAGATVAAGNSVNFPVALGTAAGAGGVSITLASSDNSIATVSPATIFIPQGLTSAPGVVTVVKGLNTGSVAITASAFGYPTASAQVQVISTIAPPPPGAISLPSIVTLAVNQSLALQVTLPAPAPAGGVTVSLASSDPSTAAVTPNVLVPAGAISAQTQPQVSGIQVGSASVTASAPGFTPGIAQVQVTSAGGGSFFSPVGGLTINAGSTQNLTLNLSPAPTGGLTVSLSSSDATVASVPATITCASDCGQITVPVTAVAAGSATITATTPGFGAATSSITVPSLNGVSITWYGACWATLTISGFTGNFQAIDFALTTPTPAVFNGSLFFTPNCDPSQGVDNLNDTGALTGSTHMIQGFLRHPDVMPSSAMYWIGNATTIDGKCPAGSLCSGCVTYTAATPNCSILP